MARRPEACALHSRRGRGAGAQRAILHKQKQRDETCHQQKCSGIQADRAVFGHCGEGPKGLAICSNTQGLRPVWRANENAGGVGIVQSILQMMQSGYGQCQHLHRKRNRRQPYADGQQERAGRMRKAWVHDTLELEIKFAVLDASDKGFHSSGVKRVTGLSAVVVLVT